MALHSKENKKNFCITAKMTVSDCLKKRKDKFEYILQILTGLRRNKFYLLWFNRTAELKKSPTTQCLIVTDILRSLSEVYSLFSVIQHCVEYSHHGRLELLSLERTVCKVGPWLESGNLDFGCSQH